MVLGDVLLPVEFNQQTHLIVEEDFDRLCGIHVIHVPLHFLTEEYRSRVGFCIPILVNASIAYDVSKRQTPEMAEQVRLWMVRWF